MESSIELSLTPELPRFGWVPQESQNHKVIYANNVADEITSFLQYVKSGRRSYLKGVVITGNKNLTNLAVAREICYGDDFTYYGAVHLLPPGGHTPQSGNCSVCYTYNSGSEMYHSFNIHKILRCDDLGSRINDHTKLTTRECHINWWTRHFSNHTNVCLKCAPVCFPIDDAADARGSPFKLVLAKPREYVDLSARRVSPKLDRAIALKNYTLTTTMHAGVRITERLTPEAREAIHHNLGKIVDVTALSHNSAQVTTVTHVPVPPGSCRYVCQPSSVVRKYNVTGSGAGTELKFTLITVFPPNAPVTKVVGEFKLLHVLVYVDDLPKFVQSGGYPLFMNNHIVRIIERGYEGTRPPYSNCDRVLDGVLAPMVESVLFSDTSEFVEKVAQTAYIGSVEYNISSPALDSGKPRCYSCRATYRSDTAGACSTKTCEFRGSIPIFRHHTGDAALFEYSSSLAETRRIRFSDRAEAINYCVYMSRSTGGRFRVIEARTHSHCMNSPPSTRCQNYPKTTITINGAPVPSCYACLEHHNALLTYHGQNRVDGGTQLRSVFYWIVLSEVDMGFLYKMSDAVQSIPIFKDSYRPISADHPKEIIEFTSGFVRAVSSNEYGRSVLTKLPKQHIIVTGGDLGLECYRDPSESGFFASLHDSVPEDDRLGEWYKIKFYVTLKSDVAPDVYNGIFASPSDGGTQRAGETFKVDVSCGDGEASVYINVVREDGYVKALNSSGCGRIVHTSQESKFVYVKTSRHIISLLCHVYNYSFSMGKRISYAMGQASNVQYAVMHKLDAGGNEIADKPRLNICNVSSRVNNNYIQYRCYHSLLDGNHPKAKGGDETLYQLSGLPLKGGDGIRMSPWVRSKFSDVIGSSTATISSVKVIRDGPFKYKGSQLRVKFRAAKRMEIMEGFPDHTYEVGRSYGEEQQVMLTIGENVFGSGLNRYSRQIKTELSVDDSIFAALNGHQNLPQPLMKDRMLSCTLVAHRSFPIWKMDVMRAGRDVLPYYKERSEGYFPDTDADEGDETLDHGALDSFSGLRI